MVKCLNSLAELHSKNHRFDLAKKEYSEMLAIYNRMAEYMKVDEETIHDIEHRLKNLSESDNVNRQYDEI